ncbi:MULTISPECIES: LPS O-antigen chain length determinant protein WzzB [Pseudomonas]|uniref:LPS O-antigen chain length determinant protein WzzB n=1 Tax=Pseudomonas TaxID=286 RepID=UPI00249B7AB7|nr:Wzz/FepE/Etk N-terminal domain-containing protein [Pseudomonas sp. PS01300]
MSTHREHVIENNEIDLVQLIRGIWRQKLLITVITMAVTATAIVYALTATPVFQAKIFVQPPTQKDIAHLNYGRGGETELERLSVQNIYDIFLRHLLSESLRRHFFQNIYLPTLPKEQRQGSQDALYAGFNQLFSVAPTGKDTPGRFAISANLPDPELAAGWVTQYANMAGELARQEVLGNVRGEATVKSNDLQLQIVSAQKSAREQREDEIVRLTEALAVAKSIGLDRPPIITINRVEEVSADMEGPLTYMRGSKALEAEIRNLQQRVSDDPFIQDIRKQQAALNFYRELRIDPEVVATFRQDGIVELPDRPIKPKKFLIALLGLFAGAGLACFVATVRYFMGLQARE